VILSCLASIWPRRLTMLAAVMAASMVLAACGGDEPADLAGYERIPVPNVSALSLPAVEADGSEQPFTFSADPEELLLVYFGYTSCPDVCPATLADLRVALEDLGERADEVDFAMVTIDPEVDTPEVLTGYVRSFIDSATAIRTLDATSLRDVADVFGADYGKETNDEGEDEVFHTASVYAIDDAGHLVLTWSFGTTPADISRDISILQDRD
jgi:protein SCO1/2